MINTLLHIAVAAVLICGRCLPAFASFESNAPWERKCDARLWGERIRADVCSAQGGAMRLGSHCDERAFMEIRRLGNKAIEGLRSCAGGGGEYARFLRLIIDNIGRIEISGMERVPRGRDHLFASMTGRGLPRGFAGRLQAKKVRMIRTASFLVPAPGGGHHPRTAAAHWNHRFEARRGFISNEYSFDTAWVDYYRLFLYLWDDTPREAPAETILLPRSASPSPIPSRVSRKKYSGSKAHASSEDPNADAQGICS